MPLGGHVRVGVAIYSYDGHVGFGVTGDYDTAPDIDVLCAGIEDGMAQLSEICGTARKGGARKGTARKGAARKGTARTGALR